MVRDGALNNKKRTFLRKVEFVHFNMAAYTLPEGFAEFDMFTFGTALLVGGKLTGTPEDMFYTRFKGTVHSDNESALNDKIPMMRLLYLVFLS